MRLHWQAYPLTLREPLRISRSTMAGRYAVELSLAHGGFTGHGEVVTSDWYGLDVPRIGVLLGLLRDRLVGADGPAALLRDLPTLALTGLGAGPDRAVTGRGAGAERAATGRRPGAIGAAGVPGLLAVLAALDAAAHDLAGQLDGVPVHRLVGQPTWQPVDTAYTIGLLSPPRSAAVARRLTAAGFRCLKIKAGSADPDEDVARVAAVRAAAPQARLLLDPNGGWTAETAVRLLDALTPYRLDAVEQPVPAGDPARLAWIGARTDVPVIADEDAATVEDVHRLAGAVAGVNVKLVKCGGLRAALEIVEAAHRHGLRVMLGCLVASSLGIAPAVHLTGYAHWVDLDGHLLLTDDPWTGLGGEDGTLRLTGAPGLGVRRRREGTAEPIRGVGHAGAARSTVRPEVAPR